MTSHRKRDVMLSLYIPAAAAGISTGMTAPVLPILAKSFDVSIGIASLVFIVHMAGSAVGTIPTGLLIDRIGRRKVLLIGPIITAIAAIMIATADSFGEILVYRFIGGWGQQMWALSRLTLIADTAGASRGRQVTSMLSAQRVGTLIGPALGGGVAAAWGLQLPFVIQGVVLLVGMLPSYFVVKEIDSIKNAKAKGEFSPKLSWRSFLVSPIPAVFSAQFLVNVARGGVENGGVLFLYAAYAYGDEASVVVLGVLSSIMAGVSIPIALASGVVMDKRGRRFTLIPGTISLTLALLLMAATSYANLSFIWFIAGFAANHVAVSVMLGSWQTIGTDVAPKEGRGTFFGTSRLISHTGRLSSPGSFAVLSEVGSYGIAFTFLATASLAASGIIMFFVKETLHLQDNAPVLPAKSAIPDGGENPTATR